MRQLCEAWILMFIPAQWPLARKNHWVTLVTARAIENQMYVCAVNACGYAGETKYGGKFSVDKSVG